MSRLTIVVGLLIGSAYTASPLFVVFALCLVPLVGWAANGVEGRERRWLLAILAAAILIRLAAIAALSLAPTADAHSFNVFVPDARFAIARSWWIRNQWLGVEIGPIYRLAIYNPYGATSYSYILAAIQLLFGESPYGLNLVSVLAFFVAAIALYRAVRASYGSTPALVGLAMLVFWPTMIVWSVSALRESFQLAMTAIALVVVIRAVRSRRWTERVIGWLLALAALAAIRTLRSGVIAIVAGGLIGGLSARLATLRPMVARAGLVAVVVLLAILIPRPGLQQRFLALARDAVMRHVGNVATTGNGYKVLDDRFYIVNIDDIINTLTPAEALDFVIRSAGAFFVVPLPWQVSSRSEMAFLPEQLWWYTLLACAVVGIFAGHRRDPLLTWLLLAYIGAAVVVIAPNSGNIGTLVRHRDTVMIALVWIAAAGIHAAMIAYARRAARHALVDGPLTGGVVA